jgi:hypothetical protein
MALESVVPQYNMNSPGGINNFHFLGTISMVNMNPNACSGWSKEPAYRYQMVERRRKLVKGGYRFGTKRSGQRDKI